MTTYPKVCSREEAIQCVLNGGEALVLEPSTHLRTHLILCQYNQEELSPKVLGVSLDSGGSGRLENVPDGSDLIFTIIKPPPQRINYTLPEAIQEVLSTGTPMVSQDGDFELKLNNGTIACFELGQPSNFIPPRTWVKKRTPSSTGEMTCAPNTSLDPVIGAIRACWDAHEGFLHVSWQAY